jgi:NAD(P)-dependent dehydrogenase (short-subunit alcohol dehydrogenase family)
MRRLFEDKVALVTGAGSGIGRATAVAFANDGAKVVVADVVVQGGEETVKMIKDAGGQAMFIKADVSRWAEVEEMVQKTVAAYGRLDCACNNAGINGGAHTLTRCTEELWDRVMGINLKGVWLCMKYEVLQMRRQGGGSIVNIASMLGLVGSAGSPAYVASKHGVVELTKSAALEYAQKGIRVNAIAPGNIDTPMNRRLVADHPQLETWLVEAEPIGRMGKPEEIATVVLWLCSDGASFVTGHALSVDGGIVAGPMLAPNN